MEENRIPEKALYMNLGTTRLRSRPRNRWQDKVREDGRIVGGEGWQQKINKREEWKKIMRKERNSRIMKMNECLLPCTPVYSKDTTSNVNCYIITAKFHYI
jgi:hypothetical protein